jgi:hypothetical protein
VVHVDDFNPNPMLLQEQGRDQTDRTSADDENVRVRVMKHGLAPADPVATSVPTLLLKNPCGFHVRRRRYAE